MSKCPDPTNCGAKGKCGDEDPVPDPYDEGHLCKDCGVWEDPTEPHDHFGPGPGASTTEQTEGYLAEIKRQGNQRNRCASGCDCDEKGAMHEGPCVFSGEPDLVQRLMPLGSNPNDYPDFLPDEVAWLAARGYKHINRNAPPPVVNKVRMHSNGALGCFNIMDMMEGQKESLCAEVERLKTKLGDVCEMGVRDSARADAAKKALTTKTEECERLTVDFQRWRDDGYTREAKAGLIRTKLEDERDAWKVSANTVDLITERDKFAVLLQRARNYIDVDNRTTQSFDAEIVSALKNWTAGSRKKQ